MNLKSSYDNFDAASDETGLKCEDRSLTQQHDEPEANINNIVSRYLKTGSIETHKMPPLQGDFSNAPDMQTAMNLGVAARVAFMDQPAKVRTRFNNDPAEFVEFVSDPDNIQELAKLGLLSQEATDRLQTDENNRIIQAEKDRRDAEAFRQLDKTTKSV